MRRSGLSLYFLSSHFTWKRMREADLMCCASFVTDRTHIITWWHLHMRSSAGETLSRCTSFNQVSSMSTNQISRESHFIVLTECRFIPFEIGHEISMQDCKASLSLDKGRTLSTFVEVWKLDQGLETGKIGEFDRILVGARPGRMAKRIVALRWRDQMTRLKSSWCRKYKEAWKQSAKT